MSKLEILTGNKVYLLSDNISFFYLGSDGFGLPNVDRFSQSGPFQDGYTDLGFTLSTKTIVLNFVASGSDKAAYRTIRQLIGQIFRPRIQPLIVRYTDSLNVVYQIEGHYVSGASLPMNDKINVYTHKFSIALSTPKPYWYNPTQQVFVYGVGGAAGNFSFPITFPVTFGVSTLNQNKLIQYQGSWKTYPTITINGPIVNPVITNTSTGEKLDFTGLTLNAGESIVIDTNYGYKTITKNDGSNLISALSSNSDLATFHIASDDEVADARNNISVTGSSITSATEIYIRYFENYISI